MRRDTLNNLETVKRVLIEAAECAQATIVGVVFHQSNPVGISGVVIAESHLSIHTWPEHRYAAVDVFSCCNSLRVEAAGQYITEQFGAQRVSVVDLPRGMALAGAEGRKGRTPAVKRLSEYQNTTARTSHPAAIAARE